MAGRYVRPVLIKHEKQVEIMKNVAEIPGENIGSRREKQMCAIHGTVPENKEKRAVCRDKTDRPFLGNLIDTGQEL